MDYTAYFTGSLPRQQHPQDAGYDLTAAHEAVLNPGDTVIVETPHSVAIPDGVVGLVCSRSGLAAKHSVWVANAPGVIDPGYTGQIGVILHNAGRHKYQVSKGDRIAQLVLVPTIHPTWHYKRPLDDTQRGDAGFGSTGDAA